MIQTGAIEILNQYNPTTKLFNLYLVAEGPARGIDGYEHPDF